MILITIDIEAVVESQLIARIDITERMDENFPALDPGLAVRSA